MVWPLFTKKIIHCDIKPENIVLKVLPDKRLSYKIIDFGLSKLINIPGDMKNTYVVSRWYRAPELLLGKKKDISPSIDIWSVFCIVIELCTNQVLFNASTDDFHDTINEDIKQHVMGIYQFNTILHVLRHPHCWERYMTFSSDLHVNASENIVNMVHLSMNDLPRETYFKADSEKILRDIGDEIVKIRPQFKNRMCLIDRLINYFSFRIVNVNFVNLINKMCHVNCQSRITAKEILDHPFLAS